MLAYDRAAAATQVTAFRMAELAQIGLGGHASVEAKDAGAGTEACFEGLDHGQERGGVRAVARQRFIAQGEAVAVDDQADAQLFAIGPMIAGVAALGLGIILQAPLEIGAGQVVQEQIVLEVKQIACLLGEVVLDGLLVGFDEAEAAVQMVERQAGQAEVEEFGQGRAGYPGVDAAFAAGIDQAVDGNEGGDVSHGHAGGDGSQETLQQAVEAEVLPGAESNVDVAEPTGMPPGNGSRDDLDGGDRARAGRRRHITDLLLEAWQPSGIGQTFGNAQPVRRSQVVEPPEVADGALTDGAGGGAYGLHQGEVGVSTPVSRLEKAT
jgi:hypothetical protein